METFDVEKIGRSLPVRDERHPYNIWGEKGKKRKKFKKKKPQSKKKNGHIDIYV